MGASAAGTGVGTAAAAAAATTSEGVQTAARRTVVERIACMCVRANRIRRGPGRGLLCGTLEPFGARLSLIGVYLFQSIESAAMECQDWWKESEETSTQQFIARRCSVELPALRLLKATEVQHGIVALDMTWNRRVVKLGS